VFFLPGDVDVITLRSDAVYPGICAPLYYDDHGEPDRSLSRGKPLYLSAEKLEEIRVMIRDCLADDKCSSQYTLKTSITDV